MPTLAEMRARKSEPAPRPRKTVTVTLVEGQHLLDEIERLDSELKAIYRKTVGEAAAADDAARGDGHDGDGIARDAAGRPLKSAERSTPPGVEEIRARIAELEAKRPEFQADLTLVGLEPGEWQLFKQEHPARVSGYHETVRKNGDKVRGGPILDQVDVVYAFGFCDADAIFSSLGQFAAEWEGEPLAAGEWDEWLAARIIYADRRDLVGDVVRMHEERGDLAPKSPSGSSATTPG